MPSGLEIRAQQKRMLFALKKLEQHEKGIHFRELKELIVAIETEMEQEDIAFVEKQVSRKI